jgi:hypothetical protein
MPGIFFDVQDAVSFGMKAACLKRARTATPDPRGIDPTVEIDSLASLVIYLAPDHCYDS